MNKRQLLKKLRKSTEYKYLKYLGLSETKEHIVISRAYKKEFGINNKSKPFMVLEGKFGHCDQEEPIVYVIYFKFALQVLSHDRTCEVDDVIESKNPDIYKNYIEIFNEIYDIHTGCTNAEISILKEKEYIYPNSNSKKDKLKSLNQNLNNERKIINSIKKENLPLYTNHKWRTKVGHLQFLKRLKNAA